MDSETTQLFHHLNRAHHQMQGLLVREISKMGGKNLGLQPGMRPVFCALREGDGMAVSELTAYLNLAKSSVTGAVRRMVAAGLLEQKQDGVDGRRKRLKLTEEGRNVIPLCEKIDALVGGRLETHFEPGEISEMLRLLNKLTDCLAVPEPV